MTYHRPATLDEAVTTAAAGPCVVLAGGTDIFPALQGRPLTTPVLDLTGIAALRGISENAEGWRIGATTSWAEIAKTALPPAFNALQQAAREVGSVQIQSRATIAGNICNASPAADGLPPLLALDASVVLASGSGTRQMPLSKFVLGNRRQALKPGELLSEIRISRKAAQGVSHFAKLGARRYLVISIAMLAVRLAATGGKISQCAIAVGACSAVAQRLHRLEHVLLGRRVGDLSTIAIDPVFLDGLTPLSDVRSPAAYRLDAVAELLARTIITTAGELQ